MEAQQQDPSFFESSLSSWHPVPLGESFETFYLSQTGEKMSPFQKGLVDQAAKKAEESR